MNEVKLRGTITQLRVTDKCAWGLIQPNGEKIKIEFKMFASSDEKRFKVVSGAMQTYKDAEQTYELNGTLKYLKEKDGQWKLYVIVV